MKAFSAIGIAVCIGGLFLGATLEGSNVMAVLRKSSEPLAAATVSLTIMF